MARFIASKPVPAPAPVPDGSPEAPVLPASLAKLPTLDETATSDAKSAKMTEEYMRQYYSTQEKVSVKCQEDEWVQVNGYTFVIKGGERVMVPKDIAAMLEEAGRI